ncbi:hypothetical protein J010_01400 [Cryptococcus neoformans]|uniref:Uncharacterized protein n=1 Tax=Cryptococcus neoformans Tu259-1 TaxID=1230072 RepID=A0A854QQ35_CRYNE|nr:hypothetical protein C353_01443 [Cryptococcus neoformans var. grubii AD1-83a]OXG26655.1 hypothetical protein C361_01416 [Cryptococcus neoformans var. grubii Tu259-1]OXG52964.1 hypothetical protein C355_01527 [Cryptococcus neoformans var. grubii Th84]OXG65868.1 hypothetical protein C354_01454 [Cryptococcus neoformans var. grubii MW-RSA1955]OXG67509.1 hypothetical protein C351_01279 [Cryptococcus neoformans var. grubii c8]OXG70839.1 hypothetical protein C352_01460 [Cryptococcus neoformans var
MMMCMMNSYSLPMSIMGARWKDGIGWRLKRGSGPLSWLQAQDKAKRRSTPVFHLPYKYHGTISMGFRLASGPSSLEDIRDGLFHPTAAYTKGMIDWEAAQKKLPDGTSAVIFDPQGSRILNGGFKSPVYAGLNAPPEHHRLWEEDPNEYRARRENDYPELPHITGFPGYFFLPELVVDETNIDEANRLLFISPMLVKVCRVLLISASQVDAKLGKGLKGRPAVAGQKLSFHWRHILYVAGLLGHAHSTVQTVGQSNKHIMEYTTLHYDLVDIMTSLSPDRMNHLVTTYQQEIYGSENVDRRRATDLNAQARPAMFGV